MKQHGSSLLLRRSRTRITLSRRVTKGLWGNIGVMEKKMETTIVYRDNIGVMEKKMETTI